MILIFSPYPTLERVALVEQFQTGKTPKPMRVATWAGGGLRAASVVQLLGSEVLALGFVGGRLGELLVDALEKQHVPRQLTPIAGSTAGSLTTLDKERGFVSDLPDALPVFSEAEAQKLITALKTHLPGAEMLILGDGGAGNGAELFAQATVEAKSAGIPVLAQVAGDALNAVVEAGAWLVQVNIKTLQKQTERSLAHDSAILQEAQAIRAQGVEKVIVTLGEEGAILVDAEGAFRVKAPIVSYFNPTGAGETLAAAFAVQYIRTQDAIDALRYGCAAASVNVTHDEPGYATPGEVAVLYPHTFASPIIIR